MQQMSETVNFRSCESDVHVLDQEYCECREKFYTVLLVRPKAETLGG